MQLCAVVLICGWHRTYRYNVLVCGGVPAMYLVISYGVPVVGIGTGGQCLRAAQDIYFKAQYFAGCEPEVM